MHLISLKYSLQAPASEIQDKISFIINNLSPANAEAKAREFSEFFQEQYYPWFAQYLVMKRYNCQTSFDINILDHLINSLGCCNCIVFPFSYMDTWSHIKSVILSEQALNQIFMTCTWSSWTKLIQSLWTKRLCKLLTKTARFMPWSIFLYVI